MQSVGRSLCHKQSRYSEFFSWVSPGVLTLAVTDHHCCSSRWRTSRGASITPSSAWGKPVSARRRGSLAGSRGPHHPSRARAASSPPSSARCSTTATPALDPSRSGFPSGRSVTTRCAQRRHPALTLPARPPQCPVLHAGTAVKHGSYHTSGVPIGHACCVEVASCLGDGRSTASLLRDRPLVHSLQHTNQGWAAIPEQLFVRTMAQPSSVELSAQRDAGVCGDTRQPGWYLTCVESHRRLDCPVVNSGFRSSMCILGVPSLKTRSKKYKFVGLGWTQWPNASTALCRLRHFHVQVLPQSGGHTRAGASPRYLDMPHALNCEPGLSPAAVAVD